MLVGAPGTPSSDPSGHLLPVGEKREIALAAECHSLLSSKTFNRTRRHKTGSLFSPTGRRWPEGSDEGVLRVRSPKTAAAKRRPGATNKARALRHNETEAVYRLWSDIRNRLLNGYKFSRQIPIGPYVVDFICRQDMLVIELDGTQHAESQYDLARTAWLNRNGYSVLRFWNHEVLQERRAVLETILAVLTGEIWSRDDAIRFSPAEIKTLANEEGTP